MDTPNKTHKTYYTDSVDFLPVLQYGEMEIQILDSEYAEMHFNEHADLHVVIDRTALARMLKCMDELK